MFADHIHQGLTKLELLSTSPQYSEADGLQYFIRSCKNLVNRNFLLIFLFHLLAPVRAGLWCVMYLNVLFLDLGRRTVLRPPPS